MKDYIEQAHATLATGFHPNRVHLGNLVQTLSELIIWTQNLDTIKKGLFYNRERAELEPGDANLNVLSYNHVLGLISPDEQISINLLHGIIGKITEAGELAEALCDTIKHSRPMDPVNILEEVGDGLWYDAVILKALGLDFEYAMTVNIAKLRKRFPNKFTEYDALNRDLTAERKELEA